MQSATFYNSKWFVLAAANTASAAVLATTFSTTPLRDCLLIGARFVSVLAHCDERYTLVRCAAIFANAVNVCMPPVISNFCTTISPGPVDTILSVVNIVNLGWPTRYEMSDAIWPPRGVPLR